MSLIISLTRHSTDSVRRHFQGPVDYVIEIHPPLVIENLLPHRGVFEIMHTEASAGRKKMLWCDTLDHGDCVPIHTVGIRDRPI